MLRAAAALLPVDLRSLDAIHLATVELVAEQAKLITYDRRMAAAGRSFGHRVSGPT